MTEFHYMRFYDEATDSFVYEGKHFDSYRELNDYRQGNEQRHFEEPLVREVEVVSFMGREVGLRVVSSEVSGVSVLRVSEVSSLDVSRKRFEMYTNGVSISEIARRVGVSLGCTEVDS